MTAIRRIKDPDVMRIIGLAALALGGCSRYLQRLSPGVENLSDFLVGMFIAIGIGCLAMSIVNRRTEP